AFEIAHLQHLVYNTLAGNGGVAVDQDGEHLVVVALVHDVGLRTDEAFDHRVDRLQMRRVGHELEIDGLIGVRCHYAAVAHMIFYVTAAHGLVRLGRSFELTEDLLIGLAHDIGQDVEAASMCHTDHDFLYGMSSGSIDNSVEGGNG